MPKLLSRRPDLLVLGSEPAGFALALECAKLGLQVSVVRVVEPELNEGTELARQLQRDAPVLHGVEDEAGGWQRLVTSLADSGAPTIDAIAAEPSWVFNEHGELHAVAEASILGIPSSALSEQVVAAIGKAAATRAYLDRLKPVLTVGKAHHLGALVRKRMGAAIERVLLEPFVTNRFGRRADEVEVAVAVPGLNEALTRTGSLANAVLALCEGYRSRHQRFTLDGLERAVDDAAEYWQIEIVHIDREQFDLDQLTSLDAGAAVLADSSHESLRWWQALAQLPLNIAYRAESLWLMSAPLKHSNVFVAAEPNDAPSMPLSAQTVAVAPNHDRDAKHMQLVVARSAAAASPEFDEVSTRQWLSRRFGEVQFVHHRTTVAPHYTLAQVHAEARIDELSFGVELPHLVAAGAFGGSDSRAISRAISLAVPLRRQLLGIA